MCYSQDGGHSREEGENSNSYNGGSSYGDYSGEHYVRGHYSRGGAKKHMTEKLKSMMKDAETDKEREAIRRCITHLENT